MENLLDFGCQGDSLQAPPGHHVEEELDPRGSQLLERRRGEKVRALGEGELLVSIDIEECPNSLGVTILWFDGAGCFQAHVPEYRLIKKE